MVSTIFAIFLALLSPCIFAFTNTIDKFIVSKKIKNTIGFTALAGIATLTFGIIMSLFLDWNGIGLSEIWPVAISGIIFGTQYFIYYKVMSRGDASNFSGLTYAYPILVALLSFIFLKETLSIIGYIGVVLSITGSMLLSARIKKLNGMSIVYLIGINIVLIALYEFLIKISTNNLAEWNGIALEFVFIGLTICSFFLYSKKMRKLAFREKHNIKWAFFAEFFTLLAITTTFFAMGTLSATIVAALATIQPIAVLVFERATTRFFGKIYADKITLLRMISMGLIILGVVLLITNMS
jgi:drug/metabolite transporter (DMT)-like permease